ncbi:MAG: glycosyltransferase [Actinobacteria bacterium]|nr:glycosyltransferase [Actinomycetota bacterium]
MRILIWHVHGSWTTAFVQGRHEYLLPVVPDRGPDGRGRATSWSWPGSATERTPAQLRQDDVDLVILQRPHEIELTEQWTGRRPGRDVAAAYLEHNAPEPHPVDSRHPLADQTEISVVHVTHFNQLYWDSGRAPSRVIEHGVLDPGPLYTGELAHAAAVINEPGRRGRTVGADLFDRFDGLPIDRFGMGDELIRGTTNAGDLPQARLHHELARRRAYLHLYRWTSLGLALIEAMLLGLPVVTLAATATALAVAPGSGVVSSDIEVLRAAVRHFLADADAARAAGQLARRHALHRYGIDRFLDDWDDLIKEVTG